MIVMTKTKMSNNDFFSLDIVPLAKPRMVRSDAWKKRKCVLRYWDYKNELILSAKKQNFILEDSYEVLFTLPIPKLFSKKKKQGLVGECHRVKPDLDNLVKAINDCFNIADQSIYSIKAQKVYGETPSVKIHNCKITKMDFKELVEYKIKIRDKK